MSRRESTVASLVVRTPSGWTTSARRTGPEGVRSLIAACNDLPPQFAGVVIQYGTGEVLARHDAEAQA